jgi:peptidoglycan/LPS O-acetylase OafA/YrhL
MNGTGMHNAFAGAYRSDIDGLRALAVIAVVLFHARLGPFGGGFVGVDVFFVISGFLITSIIKKEMDRGEFTLLGFYERRVRRILPALFVVLAATSAIALAVLLPVETLFYGKTLAATALFGANVQLWREAGYFAENSERNPLLHMWSLGVEEQFYFVFPIALLLLLRFVGARTAVAWLGAALLASLALAEYLVPDQTPTAFYLLPPRAWELLLGAALALARLPAPARRLATVCGAAGLALIVGPVLTYSQATPFPGASAIPPCAGAALLLYAGASRGTAVQRALAAPPVAFVGKISYSLYLWHWPLLVLARIALDRELGMLESVALVALALGLATLSWKFVETPFRRAKLGGSRTVVTAGVAASLALCATGAVLIGSGGAPGRYPAAVVTADAASSDEVYPPSCVGPNAESAGACADETFDLLVWGDSHAAHLFAGLERRAADAGLTARVQWVGGCPPAQDATPVTLPPAEGGSDEAKIDRRCARFNREILDLATNGRVRAVALAGAWSFWSEGVDIGSGERRYLVGGHEKPAVEESRRGLREGLGRTVAELRAHGVEVLLVAQVPDNVEDPPHCIALAYLAEQDPAECGRRSAEALARLSFSRQMLGEIAARYGAYLFDPAAQLCTDERCAVAANGVPLYRDEDHLSLYGSRLVAAGAEPAFFKAVAALRR